MRSSAMLSVQGAVLYELRFASRSWGGGEDERTDVRSMSGIVYAGRTSRHPSDPGAYKLDDSGVSA